MQILIDSNDVVVAKNKNIQEDEIYFIIDNTYYQKDTGLALIDLGELLPEDEPIVQKHRYSNGIVLDNPDYVEPFKERIQKAVEAGLLTQEQANELLGI